MSSPLAIGAVSAVLRNLLDNGLIELGGAMGGPVMVTSVAPDTIDLEDANLTPRLNLFLYLVTPNAGWRNQGLPSRSAANGERLTNAPLALDLHYLVTAYGRADFQAEILLGYAMHLLHERPVLDREAIRRTLTGGPIDPSQLPPALGALVASDLADQAELIKITPAVQSSDEMSKLWSAIQSKYRPSSAYQVSVVLIEGKRPAVTPLPVLSRGGLPDPTTGRDRGVVVNPDLLPPLPTLFAAEPDNNQTAARLGEKVTVSGVRLAGSDHEVLLAHRLLNAPFPVTPDTVSDDGTVVTLTLPALAGQSGLAAGPLAATIRFKPTGETEARDTNAVPLVLAPVPVITPTVATRALAPAPTIVTVTLATEPEVRPEQQAVLILDTVEAAAAPRSLPADPLVFEFPASLPGGTYRARLRIDGIDSILIDRSGPAPAFDESQKIVVPS